MLCFCFQLKPPLVIRPAIQKYNCYDDEQHHHKDYCFNHQSAPCSFLKSDHSEFVGNMFAFRICGMKSVECVEYLPKFGGRVKSFGFDILIGNGSPSHSQTRRIFNLANRLSAEGCVAPNGRNRGWLWALSGGDGFGFSLPAESFLHSLR